MSMRYSKITLLFDTLTGWLRVVRYFVSLSLSSSISLHGLALALIQADCEREALNKASSYDWPITNSINLSDN